jgi:outer membrane biosynthesis protein TonB
MQVNIQITLDLPADTDRLFRLTELMNSTDTMTTMTTMAPTTPTPKPVPPPIPMPPPEPTPTPPAAAAEPVKAPRKPRAAKAAPPPVEDTGLADSDDPVPDLNGPVDDDDDDDGSSLGLAAPSMTGQDALESGLGKVRVMYAKGHKVSVKQLQQQFNVASFQDIPPTEGHKFLATVIKLEEQLGLRV